MNTTSPTTTRDTCLQWWASHDGHTAAQVAEHFNGDGAQALAEGAGPIKPATLRQWKARHGLPATPSTTKSTPKPAPLADPIEAAAVQPAAVWIDVGDVVPWVDNPRDNDDAAERVAESIARFGYGRAFVGWRPDGERMLVVGHTARKASLILRDRRPVYAFQTDGDGCRGCGQPLDGKHAAGCAVAIPPEVPREGMIPMRWRADWTEAEARAYAIADNQLGSLSEWMPDLLAEQLADLEQHDLGHGLLGWDQETDLAALLADLTDEHKEDTETEDNDAEVSVPEVPLSIKGEIYQLGPHRLICGDCRDPGDVARLLDGKEINVAFTSPPYASQRTYDESSGFKPIKPDKFVDWFEAVQANVGKHLATDGSWFVNIKEHCSDGQRSLYVKDLTLAHVRRWVWRFIDEFCWMRPSLPGRFPNRFKNGWEPVFHFAKDKTIKHRPENVLLTNTDLSGALTSSEVKAAGRQAGYTNEGSNGGPGFVRSKEFGGALPSNVLQVSGVQRGIEHSAAFPVALPKWFILAYTDNNDVVFDPFLGSGTTLIAAAKHGRVCYGTEISAGYCDVIRRRWTRWAKENGHAVGSGGLDELKEEG